MSKVGLKLKAMKKVAAKDDHSSKLMTNIPAGMATAGSLLGQDFNERTKDMKEGGPLPCRVRVTTDPSYDLVIHKPLATFFLKLAAGIQRGAILPRKITLKHLYETAKIKSEDPPMALLELKDICNMFVGVAHSCGIQVIRDLDPEEHGQFLEEKNYC